MTTAINRVVARVASVVGRLLFFRQHDWLLTDEKTEIFGNIYRTAVENGPNNPVKYQCEHPRWEFLRYLVEEKGITVVLVTHDPNVAKEGDRVVHMEDGKIAREE